MTSIPTEALERINGERSLTREELRLWLDRPCPKRCEDDIERDERDWVEFELARVGLELFEAGHA